METWQSKCVSMSVCARACVCVSERDRGGWWFNVGGFVGVQVFTLGKVGTAHSTFTCVTTQEISQNPLLSHSVLVQACGNGHTHSDTHMHTHTRACSRTHCLCFIPSGIWRKVSGLSLVYLWLCTQALLSSLSFSPSFPPSLLLLLLLLQASLLSLSFLILPVFFSLPPSTSLGLPISSLLSSPRPLYLPSPPSSFCVCLSRPLFFQFFFSPLLSSSRSLYLPLAASNSPSLSCSPLASLCNNKLRTNSMYISLFSPPDNSIHFSRALHSEWWMHWLCN